ncbi:MAG: hypothetical protein OHK0029_20660 [Armatimonadaceae bacterium]
MPVLTIDAESVCRVAGRDAADEDIFEEAVDVVCAEQEAIEAELQETALADSSRTRLLTVNVTRLLAAELIERLARMPGASGNVQAAGITISSVPDHATRLREMANAALAPYRKRPQAMLSPDTPSPASRDTQNRLFGKAEGERYSEWL